MSDDWPDKRREIAYTEARAVIDAQNATMGDIDDKAMRTVRLNAILLGLLVTGIQFAPELFATMVLQVAFVFLILSTVCGIITYNESDLYVGAGGDYLESLGAETFDEQPWYEHLTRTLGGMIAENHSEIRRNEKWLTAMQITLIVGIGSAVAAVAI